jgi:DNA-binding NtrC family response regulator
VIHNETANLQAFSGPEDSLTRKGLEVLPRLESGASITSQACLPLDFDPSVSYGQTRRTLELEFERRYVSWLLERHQRNISAEAREARMDRKHLHDLAKKHGLRHSRGNDRR